MDRYIDSGFLNKRRFLKTCALGACGIAFGVKRLDAADRILAERFPPPPSSDELWKWSKEAEFYVKTSDGVQCQKCPHGCFLVEGDSGICRNRINYQGKMYSIAYGNPCAVHIDPIEKKPLFHFLPSTTAYSIAVAGCNLRCLNCQNWQISQFSPKETQNYDLMPDRVVEECLTAKCESIAYTYSEPNTFYEYGYDTAKLARAHGIKNVWKSSGFINEAPLRKLCKVIDAANIDLKSFDAEIYKKLNSAQLEPVLRTLKVLKEEGVWLEITNLVIPSWTDDLGMIRRMCDWIIMNKLGDCPVHFDRFVPLYKLDQLPQTPVVTLEKARDIALLAGIEYPYIGNVPGHSAENTWCHKCHKMIIERHGFVVVNNQVKNNRCAFCGEKIPGVWKKS